MGVVILGANTLYINFCLDTHGVQRVLSLQVLALVITNRKKVAFYILRDAIIFSVRTMSVDRGGPLLSQLPVSLAELPMPPSLEPKLHKKVCGCGWMWGVEDFEK